MAPRSFFSGDTSVAFSMAAAGSTIAFLRGDEYAPYVAVGSRLAATTAGVLRISANSPRSYSSVRHSARA